MSATAVPRFSTSQTPRPRPTEGKILVPRMSDDAVDEDPDVADVVALLDDEHVRSILVATSAEPLSAKELGEHCDLSVSSIYRRVDELCDCALLTERTRPRRDGHHETVYVSTLDRFELTIRDGELDWTIDRTESDPADELSRMWGQL